MRSTQFDDRPLFEETPEEHRSRNQTDMLCEQLKRLGYARNNQVTLYGKVFDLVSDPIKVGVDFVFVDALERKSGRVMRVTLPRAIVQRARKERPAA